MFVGMQMQRFEERCQAEASQERAATESLGRSASETCLR